jgi:hypothetical protein
MFTTSWKGDGHFNALYQFVGGRGKAETQHPSRSTSFCKMNYEVSMEIHRSSEAGRFVYPHLPRSLVGSITILEFWSLGVAEHICSIIL